MTDSPDRRRDDPTQAFGGGYPTYPGYSDPAYAGQAPYGSPYQPPPGPRPTEQLPPYSSYGYDPYATGQYPSGPTASYGSEPPPPEDPKPPRWLWVVAGLAVLTIIGLVIALVIVNSSRQQTVMAPAPAAPEPSFTTTRPTPTTTSRPPRTSVLPLPTQPSSPITTPEQTTPSGPTDTVVYTVSGTGRVINITYVDTGGLLQTEFNVMLPWTREVSLPDPAERSASVSIINVGREVTCSITVNGTQVQQRDGAGLTVCSAGRR
ncbi:MAG: MmpS family transport accessory protein [Mycobacterium kyogaense]|uniref:MmpS family transport accessory protein n=1 Tax=Mycobacterium kyogaense TaxID=2212479 RepID=UPI002FFCDD52